MALRHSAKVAVRKAVASLRAGGIVAFPTETVYGLGADARNPAAVRRIFELKGRPVTHPLIVHIADARALSAWASHVPELARRLAKAFWPGPLTMILRRSATVSDAVTGGLETVALRVPAHRLALALLREFGGGVAAPSANRFGRVSATTAAHVRQEFGARVDFLLDGGACRVGVESTIVDLSSARPAILRPGGVTREALERVAGVPFPVRKKSAVRSPGQFRRHYAPRARIVLLPASQILKRARAWARRKVRVAVLSPRRSGFPEAVRVVPLPRSDAAFARKLYRLLRKLDEEGVELVLASLPAERGIGLAIADRLRRASARPSHHGDTKTRKSLG